MKHTDSGFNLEVTQRGASDAVPCRGVGHSVIVSLGSNYGDRHNALARAVEWLGERLQSLRVSSFYETVALADRNGLRSQPTYLNAVAKGIYTEGELVEFEKSVKKYEREMGRTSSMRALGLVPIDIDIVYSDGELRRPGDASHDYFVIGMSQIEPGV